ncbi:hypothetical protein GCM10010967_00510 [Dyadobacter beijingensis]|uniref:Uncharacterized protein n=1 Tax=Dyadobacter beijingensis TaxID=365489 RepID=A0ABQ2HBW2_9BACT|nr:hypothetical protein [Dyadobacter beijingensis]GGM72946.1 hypothetical protein GCM10010967_00510 [Dyadobacter beijingensis]
MNSTISKDAITRMRGAYQAKYGFEMDEWTAVMLTELHEHFHDFGKNVAQSNSEIGKAAQLIKGQINQVHFKNDRQAFWYGMSRLLPPSLVTLVGVLLIAYFVNQGNKYQEIARFEDSYPNFEHFRQLIRNGALHEEKNTTYLVLRPASNISSMKIGEEYQYIKKQNVVLVPLDVDNQ